MCFKESVVFLIISLALARASLIPTVEVLQGPGSRTTLLGPDGGAVDSVAPGGTLVTDAHGTGLVAAGPALLPTGPAVVVNGPAGSIATSYTSSGPAIVPGIVPALAAAAVAANEGAYVADISEALGDDGSYRGEH